MIYVISGDGVIAPDELTDTLGTLWDDHSDRNEPFSVVVPFAGDDRPDWVDGVLSWLHDENALFYIVAPSSLDTSEVSSKKVRDAAEDVVLARRLQDRLFTFSDKLSEEKDEDLVMLLVSDPSDPATSDADEDLATRFLDAEVPVKFIPGLSDVGGFADAPEVPEESPEEDPEPEPTRRGSRRQKAQDEDTPEEKKSAPEEKSVSHALQQEDGSYAEADLQLLTRNEVRVIGKDIGVTPRDWRSKDAIIEAILEHQGEAPAPKGDDGDDGAEEAPEKPARSSKKSAVIENAPPVQLPGRVVVGALAFVLYADGTTEQVGLDAAEASRLVDPF